MTFTLPKAVFSGLVLIALAIYSGGSSVPLNAHQAQLNWIDQNMPNMRDWVRVMNSNEERIYDLEVKLHRHSH